MRWNQRGVRSILPATAIVLPHSSQLCRTVTLRVLWWWWGRVYIFDHHPFSITIASNKSRLTGKSKSTETTKRIKKHESNGIDRDHHLWYVSIMHHHHGKNVTDDMGLGCKGDESICACKSGQCACASCPRSASTGGGGNKVVTKTACGCAGDESVCACRTGQCICKSCPKSDKTATS